MHTKLDIKGVLIGLMFIIPTIANAEVAWYEQINRGMLRVDDGQKKNNFFVDNEYDNSLAGIQGETNINSTTKLGGKLELWVTPGNSYDRSDKVVSQLNRHGASNNMNFAYADTWIDSSIGKFTVGQGGMASNGTGAVTLADMDLISHAGASDMAGGIFFHPKGFARMVQSDDPQIGSDGALFDAISGLGLKQRVRYDSPKFGGFNLSTSVGTTKNQRIGTNGLPPHKDCADLALAYANSIQAFNLQGAAAIARYSRGSDAHITQMYDGSFAILHVNTGLNGAVSLGTQSTPITQKNKNFYYAQIGKQTELITYGKTNFAVDYWKADNTGTDNDKAKAYGIGIVQKLDKISTQLYFGVRDYKYERPGQKYDTVLAALLGVKISFTGKLL